MSYKRITRYRDPRSKRARRSYEKAYFISLFLEAMRDEDTIVIVIDEAGFGTGPLRHYGIAPVGEPAERSFPRLASNLTLNCAISKRGVEFIQYMSKYGSSTETFACYIHDLINALKTKYPSKKFLLMLDNLGAHQTTETVKVM